ncbi:glycosyltransferase, partial [Bacteroidales bacterium OttesenSCG-928-K03]|nr:glycosyltransferase [Bacteroidales bacterium OttesenSCG-928-K03]
PVSILICMRDNFHIIKKQIMALSNQEYGKYEIIVVNYTAQDTENEDFTMWVRQVPNLIFFTIHERSNFKCSKIYPLSIGVKAAQYDLVITTHLDCIPTSIYWLRSMVASLNSKHNVAGIANFKSGKGFFNKLIRYEQSKYNMEFLSYIANGHPYTISTRNFLFKKSDFLIPENLVNYFQACNDGTAVFNKFTGKSETSYIFDDYAQISIESKQNLATWFTHVSRRYSNVMYSKSIGKTIKVIYALSTFLFFISCLLLCIFFNQFILPIIALILIRIILWYFLRRKALKKLNQVDLINTFPILDVVLWFIIPFFYLSSLKMKKNLWV